MRKILLVLAFVAAFALPAPAQLIKNKTELPMWYEKLLHKKDYKYLLIKGSNPTPDVDRLMAAPDSYQMVVWQASPKATKETDVKRIMSWVAGGGVLWFSDSRLAEGFGFVNFPVDGSSLPPNGFKPDFKPYDDGKAEGASMFSMSNKPASHPLLSGVDVVQMWVLRVGDGSSGDPKKPGQYSAVKATKDVTPLLRYDPVSNGPMHDNLASAVRDVEAGAVVFKPLVWEEQQTGGRFQYNLLEWSLGFGVPDPTASGPSAWRSRRKAAQGGNATNSDVASQLDQVMLLDKNVVAGTIITRQLKLVQLEPVLTDEKISFDQVQSIALQVDGAHDMVTLRNGARRQGSVSFPQDLEMRVANGSVRKIKKSEILRVTMHSASSAPQKGK